MDSGGFFNLGTKLKVKKMKRGKWGKGEIRKEEESGEKRVLCGWNSWGSNWQKL